MTDAVLEEILDEIGEEDPQCTKCETPMVTGNHWRRASAAERAELVDDGYVRVGGRGYCAPCYRHLTPDEIAKAPRMASRRAPSKATPAIIRELVRTLEAGGSTQSVADKYGLKLSTLDGTYRRALRKGILP